MKSKFFLSTGLNSNNDFIKDLKELISLVELHGEVILQLLVETAKTSSSSEDDRIVRSIADERKVAPIALERSLNVVRFLARQMRPEGSSFGENPSDLVDDFTEIGLVKKEKSAVFVSFISRIATLSQGDLEKILRRKAVAHSTLPFLEAVETSAELRMIFNDRFDLTKDINSYNPDLVSATPVALIKIQVSSDSEDGLVFQTSPRTLQVLIDHLLACKQEVDIMCQRYAVKEEI